jgi:hypothetical protein
MLIALNRRAPRTKSVFDRTSSRRYSSIDYDSNGFYDNQQEHMIIDNNNNEDIRRNHFNLIDSILRDNDNVLVSLNGHDNSTVPFDDDDDDDNDNDSDEYACFILQNTISVFLEHYILCFALFLLLSFMNFS